MFLASAHVHALYFDFRFGILVPLQELFHQNIYFLT